MQCFKLRSKRALYLDNIDTAVYGFTMIYELSCEIYFHLCTPTLSVCPSVRLSKLRKLAVLAAQRQAYHERERRKLGRRVCAPKAGVVRAKTSKKTFIDANL